MAGLSKKAPRMKVNTENFEVVTFESRKKKQKTSEDEKEKEEEEQVLSKEEAEKEMKRLRHEVLKFAISGSNKEQARQKKIELLIKLGAKPPRNYNVNYKKLQVQNKIEKEKQARLGKKEDLKINEMISIKKNLKSRKEFLAAKKKKKADGKAAKKKRNQAKHKEGGLTGGYGKVK
ncbi:hypothetical protein TKK_0003362 [Trichogramma kaykai]